MAGPKRVVGVLLAAGRGMRFDPAGVQDKLLQRLPLPFGEPVAAASARHLRAAVPEVIAVVRPEGEALHRLLEEIGCSVTVCADAGLGMGHSLVQAVSQRDDADGWIIALADMPYIVPGTICALVEALHDGAGIAVPVCEGRRGNPVAFSRQHRERLLACSGDKGARALLQVWPVTEVAVTDRGIFRDIDVPDDLA